MNTRDVVTTLREEVASPGNNRFGVVIGIEKYRDDRLNLRCARADAQAVYDLMIDPECGLFPVQNVELLIDEDATKDGIWIALATLRRKAHKEDTIWIYYGGHAASEGDEFYWVPHDGDVDDLYATGLARHQIARVLRDIASERTITFLDCCHAAATAAQSHPSRDLLSADEMFQAYSGRGRVILSASDGKERSIELPEYGHGAFTHFLIKGLRGEADNDRTGVVHLDGLWQYLHGKVVKASREAGIPQTPVLGGEHSHRMALSLNPKETNRKRAIAAKIESLIGLGDDQLSTEDARYCLEILRRGPDSAAEHDVMSEFGSLLNDKIRLGTFKRIVVGARNYSSKDFKTNTAHDEPLINKSATSPAAPLLANEHFSIEFHERVQHFQSEYSLTESQICTALNTFSMKNKRLSPILEHADLIAFSNHVGVEAFLELRTLDVVESTIHRGLNFSSDDPAWTFLQNEPRPPFTMPHLSDSMKSFLNHVCSTCGGAGSNVCTICYGSKSQLCGFCDGTGHYRTGAKKYLSSRCDYCKGEKKALCKECGGADGSAICATCKGNGYAANAEFSLRNVDAIIAHCKEKDEDEFPAAYQFLQGMSICPNCNGTSHYMCPKCHGSGEQLCGFCDGTGHYRTGAKEYLSSRCDYCKGGKKTLCRQCGAVPPDSFFCSTCCGSKYVMSFCNVEVSIASASKKHSRNLPPTLKIKHEDLIVAKWRGRPEIGKLHETLNDEYWSELAVLAKQVCDDHDDKTLVDCVLTIKCYPYVSCQLTYAGKQFSICMSAINENVHVVGGKFPNKPNLLKRFMGWQ